MAIRSLNVTWWGLMLALLALCGVTAAAAEGSAANAPDGPLAALQSGSAQVILAVCLAAVTAALCLVSRELVRSYRDRISALEAAIAITAARAKAETELALSLDRLREHCAGHK